MIDFTKLLARTPEEREEFLARDRADYETRSLATIAERTRMIEALSEYTQELNDNARRFVATLAHKASRVERGTGMLGGDLLLMSTAQLSYLSDLYARLPEPSQSMRPDKVPGGEMGDRASLSRSQRYGSRPA